MHHGSYRGDVTYKPRDNRPGFHHVVTRGNNKQRIFVNSADRRAFLRSVVHVANRHGWNIYAYCLMRNHLHRMNASVEPFTVPLQCPNAFRASNTRCARA
jgi:REP element-mobilizing transposase RayT